MKSIVRAAFAAGLLSSTTLALAPVAASAADTPKLTREVNNDIADAQKALKANDYATALADVQKAQAVTDRTPYDDFMINYFLAGIYITQKDYANATAPSEAAADSPAIPDDQKKPTYFNAFQLSSNAKHYAKTIAYGQQLEALNALDAQGYAMMAQAYYETQDFAHAQQYAQKSIEMSKAAGQPANQGALVIAYNSQVKQHNTSAASETMEQMAISSNDPADWSMLIDQAIGGKSVRDEDAFSLLRLKLLINGTMRDDDYLVLASAADGRGYSTEAYNVLQKGISAGKITAAKAGPLYAHAKTGAAADARDLGQIAASAEKSKTGTQDVKLAEDYWGYGRYADAEVAVRRGIAKGGVKDQSEGPLLLGMVLVAQGKYDEAVQTLSPLSGAPAHLWLIYAKAQQKKTGSTAQTPAPSH